MLVQTRPSGRRIFVHATSIKKIRQDLPIEISNRGGHESNYRRFARINTDRNLIRAYHRSLLGALDEKVGLLRNSFFFSLPFFFAIIFR